VHVLKQSANRVNNDPSRSSKVVDLGTNRKRAYWCSAVTLVTVEHTLAAFHRYYNF